MKKVRVIYDTDFFRKEQVVDYEKLSIYYTPGAIVELLTLEVIERVEEPKTLKEKFDIHLQMGAWQDTPVKMAQIAKEHYLEVFDKAVVDMNTGPIVYGRNHDDYIRKALEEA